MWMILDDSLGQADPSDANVRSALEVLLYAVGRGEHVIAAHPSVARWLLSIDLSPVPRTVLRQVLDSAPDLLARLKSTKFRVRVVAEGVHPLRIDASEWSLPLEWIRANGVPISCILGENTRDAELFRVAAMQHGALVRTGVSIQIDVGSGGGADTPRVLATEITAKRRFVLCITDSDKVCPTAPQNHTSSECTRISSSNDWITTHVALNEREVENLLPTNLVEDVILALSPSDLDERLEALKRIAAKNDKAWAFFDLKEGTSLNAMFGACSKFWTEFREHPVCRNGSNTKCIDEGKCLAESRDACKCLIAPPLGHKIVDHVIAYLAKQSTHASAKRSSTSSNAARWGEIGALVCEWGAATPKLRS